MKFLLISEQILLFTQRNEFVLHVHCGDMKSAMPCALFDRQWFGIENNNKIIEYINHWGDEMMNKYKYYFEVLVHFHAC
jgi:hypothetical protein